MKTIKGPAIFLAQFAGDEAPFNSLDSIAEWAAGLGFVGVQIPSWDTRLVDLAQAAESKAYCDDLRATLDTHGIVVTELSTHLQGQLVAVHPAYDELFDPFASPGVRGNPAARRRGDPSSHTTPVAPQDDDGLNRGRGYALPCFSSTRWRV